MFRGAELEDSYAQHKLTVDHLSYLSMSIRIFMIILFSFVVVKSQKCCSCKKKIVTVFGFYILVLTGFLHIKSVSSSVSQTWKNAHTPFVRNIQNPGKLHGIFWGDRNNHLNFFFPHFKELLCFHISEKNIYVFLQNFAFLVSSLLAKNLPK